jgi:hypothetical protein
MTDILGVADRQHFHRSARHSAKMLYRDMSWKVEFLHEGVKDARRRARVSEEYA